MSSRRGSFVALLVLLAVVAGLAACPERALAPPEFTDGGLRDLSAFPDLARFDGFDMAMVRPNPCPAGTEFIYTLDEDTTLSRFNPMSNQFFDVGKISCPTQLGSNPNSMAINRDAIRERVMEGLSESTENLSIPGSSGYNSSLKAQKFDPEGAKKLLVAAGFPDGFGLTVHGPNNRLINDEKVAQTIAQMFTRVGIDSKVETMPMAVYAPRGAKYEFSVALIAWGGSNDLTSPMRALIACEDPAKGLGVVNWSKYCNPKVDELLLKALVTMDDPARSKMLQEAAALMSHDVALIPLYFQVSAWAVKKNISYSGRGDERTYAYNFKPR